MKLRMLQEKFSQGLMGLVISERGFKPKGLQSNKHYMPSYSPSHGELKNFCFVSVAQRVRVSHTFVYNKVDILKIIDITLTKPSQCKNIQSTLGLLL